MGLKNFYQKNRVAIFVTTSIVTSVFLAIAVDRLVLRKRKKKKKLNEDN